MRLNFFGCMITVAASYPLQRELSDYEEEEKFRKNVESSRAKYQEMSGTSDTGLSVTQFHIWKDNLED